MPGETLGLEVTRIFQNRKFQGKPEEGIEAEEFDVVKEAEQLALGKIPPLLVSVFFSKEFRPSKKTRGKISEALFRAIESNTPTGDSEKKELNWKDGLPKEVEAVTLRRFFCLTNHYWDAATGGFVLEDCVQEIQKKIDDKEKKIEGYRKKCKRCWLLIVADWALNSSALITPSKQTQNSCFYTSFESVYFLDSIIKKVTKLQTSSKIT